MPSFITPKNSAKKHLLKKYLHHSFAQTPLRSHQRKVKVRLNFNQRFHLSLNLPVQLHLKHLFAIVKCFLVLHHKFGSQQSCIGLELDQQSHTRTHQALIISNELFNQLLGNQDLDLKLKYFLNEEFSQKTQQMINLKVIYSQYRIVSLKQSKLRTYDINSKLIQKQQIKSLNFSNCLILSRVIQFKNIIQIDTNNKRSMCFFPEKLAYSFSIVQCLFQIRKMLVKCYENSECSIFSNHLRQLFNNSLGFCFIFDEQPGFYIQSRLKTLFSNEVLEKCQKSSLKVQILTLLLEFCQIISFIQKHIVKNNVINKKICFNKTHFDKLFKCNIKGRIYLNLSQLTSIILLGLNHDHKSQSENNLQCLRDWYKLFTQIVFFHIKPAQLNELIKQIVENIQTQVILVQNSTNNANFYSNFILKISAQQLKEQALFLSRKQSLINQETELIPMLSYETLLKMQKLNKQRQQLVNPCSAKLKKRNAQTQYLLFNYLTKKETSFHQKNSCLSSIFEFQRKLFQKLPIQKGEMIDIYDKSTEKKYKKQTKRKN